MDILLGVARDKQLPIALKLGARRGVNPALRSGGDGVTTLDLGFLRRLVGQNPDVKFLVTVLARGNHHELAVLARKFGNLHVYGCWWFCNIPRFVSSQPLPTHPHTMACDTHTHMCVALLLQYYHRGDHNAPGVTGHSVHSTTQ